MTLTDTELGELVDQLLADQPDPYTLTPAPYPVDTFRQDDPAEGWGSAGARELSRQQLRANRADAIATGLALAKAGTIVGVGFCLRETRELLGVGPLWPDATTAWEQAHDKHHGTPDGGPFGVPLFWTNEGPGHVALDIRRPGLCLTTDYVATGRWGVAPVDRLASWCGGTFRGWTGDLNNTEVWRPAEAFGRDDKIDLVRNALDRARANNAPQRRIDGLRKWLDALKGGK